MMRRSPLAVAALLWAPTVMAQGYPPLIVQNGQTRQLPPGTPLQTTASPIENGGGTYTATPNYVGNLSDSFIISVAGSSGTPTTTQGATGLFEKFSSASAFNALAAMAQKSASSSYARATADYAECNDTVGGITSFCEGGRFQSTLSSGNQGSGYGVVCQAGTPASGPTNIQYLIGCEGEIDNQIGPDAPTFPSFNKNAYTAGFTATNGNGSGSRYKADAAYVVNPYSVGYFRTGLLLTSAVSDTGLAATSGSSMANGIDLHLATISYSLLSGPNATPIRMSNAAGNALLNVLSVDSSNNVDIGSDITAQAVITPQVYFGAGFTTPSAKAALDTNGNLSAFTMRPLSATYAALPTCNSGTAGTVAYITDASAAITAWHQQVTAGGGSNKAFIACNGAGWYAFDY